MIDPGLVTSDARLRRVLEVARSWGVSPSRFMGSRGDLEWTENDRELALALAQWEADLCPTCSTPLSESTDPANEGRYIAKAAVRCHRCTAVSQAQGAYENTPHASALLVPVEFRRAEHEDHLRAGEPESAGL